MTESSTSASTPPNERLPGPFRVVLTGGPGGGKTTAADLFRREIGNRVIVVPEAATLLFSGGFPRPVQPATARAAQVAIYHVQRNLEDIQAARYPERVLLCDRGTADGGAYWPDGADGYYEAVGSTHQAELDRYDAVIFFETAARGGHGFESENRFRTESQTEAMDLDARLRALWMDHPRFTLIPHTVSFFRKMTTGMAILESLVAQLPHTDPDAAAAPPADPGPETG